MRFKRFKAQNSPKKPCIVSSLGPKALYYESLEPKGKSLWATLYVNIIWAAAIFICRLPLRLEKPGTKIYFKKVAWWVGVA